MIVVTLILAAVQPLHMSVSWQTAEARAAGQVLARILNTSSTGVNESVLSKEQRHELEETYRRIDATWANEDRRGRLRLSLALRRVTDGAPSAHLNLLESRFLLAEDRLVRADFLYNAATTSTAVVIEDIESGQYLAVIRNGLASELPALFQELFRVEDGPAKEAVIRRVNDEGKRIQAGSRLVVEVNGQVELLSTGADESEIGPTLRRLWGNLDGEPRARIELVLALLKASKAQFDAGSAPNPVALLAIVADSVACAGTPLATLQAGVRTVATSRDLDGIMGLQPPPEAVTRPFYRPPGWRAFDFTRSFPAQVRRLLRGDHP